MGDLRNARNTFSATCLCSGVTTPGGAYNMLPNPKMLRWQLHFFRLSFLLERQTFYFHNYERLRYLKMCLYLSQQYISKKIMSFLLLPGRGIKMTAQLINVLLAVDSH